MTANTGAARRTDPKTSKRAALEFTDAKETHKKIYRHLLRVGSKGCIAQDLVEVLGRPLNSISNRFIEMERPGWVKIIGQRINPSSKKYCNVYVAQTPPFIKSDIPSLPHVLNLRIESLEKALARAKALSSKRLREIREYKKRFGSI